MDNEEVKFEEVCPECGETMIKHSECSNPECDYYGHLVFCNHRCIKEEE